MVDLVKVEYLHSVTTLLGVSCYNVASRFNVLANQTLIVMKVYQSQNVSDITSILVTVTVAYSTIFLCSLASAAHTERTENPYWIFLF